MMDNNNSMAFEGGNNFNDISIKIIILNHLNKICKYSSVEFRGGYWEKRSMPNSQNTVIDVYVPDTREIYSNAVECLSDILYPYFDEEMKNAEIELTMELDKAFKDHTVIKESEKTETSPNNDNRVFDNDINRVLYRSIRVKISRRLFRELSKFLYRINYLDVGTIED